MFYIRVANLDDAQDILNIYAPYVEKTSITFEYDVPSVEDMKKRIETTLRHYPYIVAIQDDRVIGYAYASRYAGRKAYDWDCELSIYVKQNCHHHGVGKELYQILLSLLEIMNIQNVYACITHPNIKSEKFHESLGFKTVGIFHRCGYKFNQWHDIVWMEKRIRNTEVRDVIAFSSIKASQIQSCISNSYVQERDNMV